MNSYPQPHQETFSSRYPGPIPLQNLVPIQQFNHTNLLEPLQGDSLRNSDVYLPQNSQRLTEEGSVEQAPDQQNYVPPNQFSNNDAVEVSMRSSIRTGLIQRIHILEKRLDRGWYKVYIFWLYLMLVLNVFVVARETIYFVEYLVAFGFYAWDVVALAAVDFACTWFFRNSWIELQAISSKSLGKAKKALKSMVGFTIYYFMFMALVYIFYIPSFAIIYRIYDRGGIFVVFLGFCSVVIGITVTGAKKVRDVLQKMDYLQSRLDPSFLDA